MKVERKERAFEPVVITLETKEELQDFKDAFLLAATYCTQLESQKTRVIFLSINQKLNNV